MFVVEHVILTENLENLENFNNTSLSKLVSCEELGPASRAEIKICS